MTYTQAIARLAEIKAATEGHTPGPWKGDYLVMAGNPGSNIQDGWVYGDDILALEPDINLIASAPELLDDITTALVEEIERLRGQSTATEEKR